MPDPDLDQIRARQCDGKRRCIDENEARASAKRMHKRKKAKFNFYHCCHCGFWHIGTQRSLRQAIRRQEGKA